MYYTVIENAKIFCVLISLINNSVTSWKRIWNFWTRKSKSVGGKCREKEQQATKFLKWWKKDFLLTKVKGKFAKHSNSFIFD